MHKYKWPILICTALISLVMHWRHFNKELISWHVWRQTQTQSTINNFYEEDFNILHPKQNNRGPGNGIFRMEFPLMQWLVAGVYKIFGKHLIITRIFMFITGLFSVLGMYTLLKSIFNQDKLALIGAWAFNFSPTFFYFTINPLPDNFALCCSIWGLAFFFKWTKEKRNFTLLLSGIFLSIGTLCKLPFIVYYIVPFVYQVIQIRKEKGLKRSHLISSLLVYTPVIFPVLWYITVIPGWHGNGIREGILDNKIPFAKILDYMQHNLVSTLPESLLNYGSVIFFVAGFYFIFKNKAYKKTFFPILVSLSLAVLAYFLFEINMIAKVHDYYLFPFYPVLFILASYGAYGLLGSKKSIFKYISVLALVSLPILAHMRMIGRWNEAKPGFNKDLLIYKNELRNAVPKNALCVAGNDESTFIMFYYIDKKGWSFNNSNPDLDKMIMEGAEYLYLDTLSMQKKLNTDMYCENLVMQKGSIQVYKLKKLLH